MKLVRWIVRKTTENHKALTVTHEKAKFIEPFRAFTVRWCLSLILLLKFVQVHAHIYSFKIRICPKLIHLSQQRRREKKIADEHFANLFHLVSLRLRRWKDKLWVVISFFCMNSGCFRHFIQPIVLLILDDECHRLSNALFTQIHTGFTHWTAHTQVQAHT